MYMYIKKLKYDEELINKENMPTIIKKIIIKIKKIFNIKSINKIDENHYLCIIPKIKNIKPIEKIIKKNKKAKIVLSKELKQYISKLNIKEDRKELIYFIYDILQYISKKINIEIQLQNLYILTNEYNEKSLDVINYLIDKVKTINIVTNNLKQFKKLEEKMYEEGTIISVSNNKNKALKKANFIINLDFNNADFEQYKINFNAIIINCANEKINILKYFQGLIINNIQIVLKEKETLLQMYNEFDRLEIYKTFEITSNKFKENIRKIKENEIKISNLIGNKGIISEKEISTLGTALFVPNWNARDRP